MSRIYQPQTPFKSSSLANSSNNSTQPSSSSSSASVSPSVSATSVQAPQPTVGSVALNAKLFGNVNNSNTSNGQPILKSSFTTLNDKRQQSTTSITGAVPNNAPASIEPIKQPTLVKQPDQPPRNLTKTSPVVTSINSEINITETVSSTTNNNNSKSPTSNNTQSSTMSAGQNSDLEKLVSRLETVTNRLEGLATSGGGNAGAKSGQAASVAEEIPANVIAYDELLSGALQQFKDLSVKVGGEVKTISELVDKVFRVQRSFLIEAANTTQPTQSELLQFFQEFSKNIQEVQSFKEKSRKSDLYTHLSAVSESIGALGWIAISPAPAPYIKEMSDAAQFYTNRVLKDYKEKDVNHVNWTKGWLQLLGELQAYVKQYHTTGVSWNSTRKSQKFDAARAAKSTGSTASSGQVTTGGAAPPPPPPPPPPMPNFADLLSAEDSGSSKPKAGVSNDALFAELNKGADITKGLRQVRDDQKTHKNPNLRAGALVPSTATSSASLVTKSSNVSTVSQKPPVLELVDKKWKVEYQQGRSDLVIDQTDLKQTVYVYQCRDCTLTVKGKVNSILIDSCTKVGLLFDDVLSTVEFINSKSVQMQVLGRVPTVAIEKTDSCQVYLSRNSLDTEIISSKSSAMNVLVPNANDDDFVEHPVPEQFKTVINASRKLTTTPTECA